MTQPDILSDAPRPARVHADLERITRELLKIRSPRDDVDLVAQVRKHYASTFEYGHSPHVGDRVKVSSSGGDGVLNLVASPKHQAVRSGCEQAAKAVSDALKAVSIARRRLEDANDALHRASKRMQHRHEPEVDLPGKLPDDELARLRELQAKREPEQA